MRVFKPKYKRKGQWIDVKKWWIEVRDRRDREVRRLLRFPAETENAQLAKGLGRKIQKLIDFAALGEPNPDLIAWFQDYKSARLQDKLIEAGLLPSRVRDAARPLTEYLPEFEKACYQESKESKLKKLTTGDTQAKTTAQRVRKLIEGCGFKTWQDVSRERVNDYIESRPDGMGQQTAHFYVQSFRRFARWMVEEGYADKALKIRSEPTGDEPGRAFELDEFRRLLEAARVGPVRFSLTGQQRHLLYLLACETGLRRGELRSLTPASINFERSFVRVKGGPSGATKNKDNAVQFFTPETGQLLQEFTRGKMPNVQLFAIPDKSGKMIQADCVTAGIEIENEKGKLNFHSLRHTTGSYLAAQGVRPKELQEIMRHKDINLTMSRYTHLLSGQKQAAVNKMPRFAKPKKKGKTA